MSAAMLRRSPEVALLLLARGASMAEVGQHFGVSRQTVERILHTIAREEVRQAIQARPDLRSNHGTRTRYDRGCRCLDCTEANTIHAQKRRARGKAPVHGTVSGYRNHGCRCVQCCEAGRVANRQTQEALRSGGIKMSHGTAGRYSQGCRCLYCTDAHDKKYRQTGRRVSAMPNRPTRRIARTINGRGRTWR